MKELKNHYQNVVSGFGKGGKTLAAYLATGGQGDPVYDLYLSVYERSIQ